MAITSTKSNDAGPVQRCLGRYLDTGTVKEFDFTTGFKPRYVRVVNVTSKDMLEWYEGMADASAIKTVAAGTRTLITTLGITPLVNGITIGFDLDVVVSSEQLSIYCEG